jgi:hypothetical protein
VTSRQYLRWLQKARDMLIDSCGNQLGDVVVLVYYAVSKNGLEFKLPCNADAPEWPEEVATIPDESLPLRTPHRRILDACLPTPQSAKRIAALAGYSRLNSYVRAALADLVRWGRLIHSPDGYRLAG